MDTSRSAWLSALGDLPVEAETLFPETRGFFARRANARRAKLLAANAETLRRALEPGERIRFAARGVRYFFWEMYFAGWAAWVHNQYLLVLTDRRLLLLQVTTRGKPADLKNQIRLERIAGTKPKAFLSFSNPFALFTADGEKATFTAMPKRERKALAALLPAGGPVRRSPDAARAVEHLCPSCLRVVPGAIGEALACPEPSCRIPFRDPAKAARLSAWIPGLGDLYLRHHLFGATEFLGSTLMLGLALLAILSAALVPDAGWLLAAFAAVFLVGLPRAVDYPLTRHMARKGIVPLASRPAPGAVARNLPSFPRWAPLLFVAGVALALGIPGLLVGELRQDARFREATVAHVEAGRFDEALAGYDALKAEGALDEERRVVLLRAQLRAGDLDGAARILAELEGTPIDDDALVSEVNAALERRQTAFVAYDDGLRALLRGEPDAAAKLDPALEYFRTVRRPHLPGTRAEAMVHLAGDLLAPPVDAEATAFARRMLDAAGPDAPAAEAAVVRAALRSLAGDAPGVTAELGGVDAELSVPFRLLALEARARVARGDAERQAVAEVARALPASLSEDEALRVKALEGDTRL